MAVEVINDGTAGVLRDGPMAAESARAVSRASAAAVARRAGVEVGIADADRLLRPPVSTGKQKGFPQRGLTLPQRIAIRVDRETGPELVDRPDLVGRCHLWTGAMSTGGGRRVPYGAINEGALEGGNPSKTWRVAVVLLLLKTGFTDVPEEPDELFIPWLRRAKAYYRAKGLEVAHLCDNSMCCNPDHLDWQTHEENVYDQRWRQGWRPDCVVTPDWQARRP